MAGEDLHDMGERLLPQVRTRKVATTIFFFQVLVQRANTVEFHSKVEGGGFELG